MTTEEIIAVISEDERIVGIVMDGRGAAPSPPVPSRGDHYTEQINFTAVITQVETKEVDT